MVGTTAVGAALQNAGLELPLQRFVIILGYYYFQKPLEAGHFWDFIGAIQAMSQSSAFARNSRYV